MKTFLCALITLITVLAAAPHFPGVGCGTALANPFTTKPGDTTSGEEQPPPRSPSRKPALLKFMPFLIEWQQQLREKMSTLTREFHSTGNILPMLVLLGAAFLYGTVHAAGPGHGKAVALSYILAVNPGLVKGLAFGNILAFTHGISGILTVLGVKFIFHTGMTGSMTGVTRTTQAVSYSLILLLGLFLLIRSVRGWLKRETPEENTRAGKPPAFFSAVSIGLIPCPGVVMVMLFAVSMNMPLLGIAMGLAISAGMALTISGVAVAGITGKTALMAGFSSRSQTARTIELVLESLAGIAVTLLGAGFLMTLV